MKKDESVTNEVDRRLEDIFSEDDDSSGFNQTNDGGEDSLLRELSEDYPENSETVHDPAKSPLRELKAIVLSIDWEITDDVMNGFIEHINKIKKTYSDDKILFLFAQLLGSLGKYIQTNKSKAHPNAIKVLNSVFASFEQVVLSGKMDEAEKEKILLGQVKEFKKLKERINIRTGYPEVQTKPIKSGSISGLQPRKRKVETFGDKLARPEVQRMLPHEAYAYALEEIKHVIKAEFRSLKAELKLWREGE